VGGAAGTKLQGFVAQIDVLREQTQGRTLREIIETVEEQSGLIEHYRNEKEGADRIENLQELVTAAESFVTQEGFGRDAVAMPLDEQQNAPQLSQSPVSQGLDPNQPLLDEALRRRPVRRPPWSMPTPARRCRRCRPFWCMRRWKRATTRPRPARTPCS
jgi:DNA helicase-2/ATP-dependent DNA helicase PcrA